MSIQREFDLWLTNNEGDRISPVMQYTPAQVRTACLQPCNDFNCNLPAAKQKVDRALELARLSLGESVVDILIFARNQTVLYNGRIRYRPSKESEISQKVADSI